MIEAHRSLLRGPSGQGWPNCVITAVLKSASLQLKTETLPLPVGRAKLSGIARYLQTHTQSLNASRLWKKGKINTRTEQELIDSKNL